MATHVSDQPQSSEAARREVERTRARISETMEEIEESFNLKKEAIRDQLDVASRIREEPLKAAAIALGAGLLLGIITGGNGGAKRAAKKERRRQEERRVLWERRARKLLAIGRDQEKEIERLEHSVGRLSRRIERDEAREDRLRAKLSANRRKRWGEAIDRFSDLRAGVMERIEDAAESSAKRFRKTILRD
jgi:hypothetical protein